MKTLITVKRKIEITDADWPPIGLVEFVRWSQAQLESVPSAYRDAAQITINSEGGGCDGPWEFIEITYFRPETDHEVGVRLAEEERDRERQRQWDLWKLKELKAIYEPSA